MAQARSLGQVTLTTGGTPVRATINETTPADNLACYSILFQRDAVADTGLVYIGTASTMDGPNGTLTIAILGVPSGASLHKHEIKIDFAVDALNAADFFVEGTVNGETVLISVIEG